MKRIIWLSFLLICVPSFAFCQTQNVSQKVSYLGFKKAYEDFRIYEPLDRFFVEDHPEIQNLIYLWEENLSPRQIDTSSYKNARLVPELTVHIKTAIQNLEQTHLKMDETLPAMRSVLKKMAFQTDSGLNLINQKPDGSSSSAIQLNAHLKQTFHEYEFFIKEIYRRFGGMQSASLVTATQYHKQRAQKSNRYFAQQTVWMAQHLCFLTSQMGGNSVPDSQMQSALQLSQLLNDHLVTVEAGIKKNKAFYDTPLLEKIRLCSQELVGSVNQLLDEIDRKATFFEHNESTFLFEYYQLRPLRKAIQTKYESLMKAYKSTSYMKFD